MAGGADDRNIDNRITVTLATTMPKSGSAREDCWSEAATGVLIDAWGERYLALSRGNLKQQHWKEVADVVNASREMVGKSLKSDMQCKNRIDTVKKRFKIEKTKIEETGSSSGWLFFPKMDYLVGPANKNVVPRAPALKLVKNVESCSLSKTGSSRSEKSGDSTDTYSFKSAKKRRIMNNPNSTATSSPKCKKRVEKVGMSSSSSIRVLTGAILKLGEVYEKAESAKMRQVMEMEKQRMEFTKDLELQRMQLFLKTQLEITQMKEDAMSIYRNKNNNSHLHQHQMHANGNNNNNLNNDSTET